MTNTQTLNTGTFGTSQTHTFQLTGCAHQWAADHKSGECWVAFLRYNNAPSDQMSISEFYNWLDAG
jgi:hypothetical protein